MARRLDFPEAIEFALSGYEIGCYKTGEKFVWNKKKERLYIVPEFGKKRAFSKDDFARYMHLQFYNVGDAANLQSYLRKLV
jgi:hypothetical protein